MPERDPRKDPRQRDVVGRRQVLAVECERGTGTVYVSWAVHSGDWGACRMASWRKWAKGKEVIYAAD